MPTPPVILVDPASTAAPPPMLPEIVPAPGPVAAAPPTFPEMVLDPGLMVLDPGLMVLDPLCARPAAATRQIEITVAPVIVFIIVSPVLSFFPQQ
ncbi:MAG: hypothetical protein R6X19_06230 [Kiritimatiellia bacterium]